MSDYRGTTISGNHKTCASLGNFSRVSSRVKVNLTTESTWFGRHCRSFTRQKPCFIKKYLAFSKSVWSGDKRSPMEGHLGCSAPLAPVGRDRQ